jgi:3-oxoacyl-(acyl-carrier-protein) synthase
MLLYLKREKNIPEKDWMPMMLDAIEQKWGHPPAPDQTALYVVSEETGSDASLDFWREVLDKGPAFANPELFPFTLANAVCGAISRHFGITGPNYTFNCPTGNQEAIDEVFRQAADDQVEMNLSAIWMIVVESER